MRRLGFALLLSVSLTACVQTRQYADLQFEPPSGDYRLLVMRPDVVVGTVTTGGLVEARADWTEQARTNIIASLKEQQAARGGDVRILETRDGVDTVDANTVAELERLHAAVAQSIAIHKYGYSGHLPTKRGKGLDYTLGQDAVNFGQQTGYDYMLFMYAEDRLVGEGRVALQVLGVAGCFIGFCAPNVGGGGQLAYASLVDLHTGEVVWFNIVATGSQVAGIKFGDIRTEEGADQMIERLLGRMKPGKGARRAAKEGQ